MKDAIINHYENYDEDGRLLKDKAHSIEFLTSTRYFEKLFPKGAKVLDACAGTGIYSFYLAERGYKVTAGDLVPYNVSLIKKRQAVTPLLENIYTGDVLDLAMFEDESFDIVLCMGALYHLPEKEKREAAVRECMRVLKKGGIFAGAYINRHAVILYVCEDNLSNMDELMEYYRNGFKYGFYGSTPQEIKDIMSAAGLEQICNIGTDGIRNGIERKINNSSEEDFKKWLEYHYATCEEESISGYSLHGLYFGRKV